MSTTLLPLADAAETVDYASAGFLILCASLVRGADGVDRPLFPAPRFGGIIEARSRRGGGFWAIQSDANAYQRKLFADSLRAALALDEMQRFVADFGFATDTVRRTSDRHWTWIATKH